jgi:hypothetical protein
MGFAQFGMLEYWNNGTMGSGKMEQCFIKEFSLTSKKLRLYPLKTQLSNIPSFHYSIGKLNIIASKKSLVLNNL